MADEPLNQANLVGLTSGELDELDRLRHSLGQSVFDEIQRTTWNQFISENEPPYTSVWRALLDAWRDMVKHWS